ncbi:hypothetical protein EYE40_06485 [Glaciihabitans arcticus]|uniref:alpha-amylase n=1 Tax=Glaciihabitans arcticus TaxID=2668039 RepID=A0A4Q9GQD4_9MICO|nr:carboxypeptidase regulatory-like domain-containing protein [Glaciihabitans arcticus]TBN57076.1 hypothetical protein EYE40_06485 [Glaciihabitans arcticus]
MSTALSTRRAWPIVAVLAAIAVIASLLVPITAQAAPIALSGRVASSSGALLVGVPISVVALAAPTTAVASTVSKAGGSFTFPSLAAGSYTLRFGTSATTFEQYLGSVTRIDAAQPITLTDAGSHQSWINATVALGGSIAGKVLTSTGKALKSYTVEVLAKNASGAWTKVRSAKTAATGAYTVAGLEPAYYRLRAVDVTSASPAYAPQYSGPSITLAGATEVGVAPAASTAYTFRLGGAGKASGTVTGSFNANQVEKLAGVVVMPYRLSGTVGAYTSAEKLPVSATTTAAGGYALAGLAPGTYTLAFAPRTSAPLPASGTVYGRAFLGGGTNPLTASTFVVGTATSATAKNIQLSAGGSISGVIAKSGALPNPVIPNLVVGLGYASGPVDQVPLATTTTDSSGHYTFDGLAPGDYRLILGSLTAGDTSWVRATITVVGLGNNEDRDRPLWLSKRDAAGLHPLAGFVPSFSPGLGRVGGAASVTSGTWNAGPDVTFGYQWLRDGKPIAGATSAGYVYTAGDVNTSISARVSATDFAYGTGSYTTSATADIVVGTPVQTAPGSITGDRHVGSTLTAVPASFAMPGVVTSFTWVASAVPAGTGKVVGSGPTHVVTAVDITSGPYLSVWVDYERAGYDDIPQQNLDAGLALPGTITLTSAPKVTSKGGKLTVSTGKWSVIPTGYSYVWHVQAHPGDPTTVSGKTLSLAGRTKSRITVTVTATRAGYLDGSTTRTARTGAAATASGSLAVGGPRRVGDSLSAPSLLWTPFPTTYSYKWQHRSGSTWKNIAGATNGNLTVPLSMLGKNVRVISTASSPGFATRSVTSKPSGPIGAGLAPAISLAPGKGVLVLGPVAVNGTVEAKPGTWVPAQSSNGYRWKYATKPGGPFTIIPGATKATLTIPLSLQGKLLFVDVTAARPGHKTGSTTVAAGTVMAGFLAPSKTPLVSRAGSVYSVSTGTWTPTAVQFSYSWFAIDEGNQLVGPLSTTNSVDASAIGNRPLIVKVEASAPGYAPGDSGFLVARAGTLHASVPPMIVGTGGVGSPLTAPTVDWGSVTAVTALQWQQLSGSTWKNLAGKTSATLTPTPAMLGSTLRLRLVGSAFRYGTVTTYTPSMKVVLGAAPVPGVATPPTLSNAPHSGEKITVAAGVWSVPSAFAYQWRTSVDGSGWTVIPGATKASYVIPADRFGWHYSVVISAKAAGRITGSTIVDAGPTGNGQLMNVSAPKVTKVGAALTVSAGSWSRPATSIKYVWQSVDPLTGNGIAVSNSASYTPVAADAGRYLRVGVQAERAGYLPGVMIVTAQLGSAITAVTPSTVSGFAKVGSVLTVTTGTWSVAGTTAHYQWLRNGKPIAGATGASYTQVAADVARVVSVRVTGALLGYPSAVTTIARPVTVNALVPTALTLPKISGEYSYSHYAVDEKITVSAGTWNMSGLVFGYQWLRSGAPIPGATGKHYTVQGADNGAELSVVVRAKRANYSTGSATSAAVSIVHTSGDYIVWNSYLEISGTGALGSPLTSNTVKWTAPTTETYQWFRYIAGNSVAIPGATAKSYTPLASDGTVTGDEVYLRIVASRPGWNDGEANSNPITIK